MSISQLIIKGNQDRNSKSTETCRQILMQRPLRNTAYYLAPHGFLSLLSYNTQGHEPREGTTHNDLGPFPQSQIRKMSDRLAYSPSYVGSFSTEAPSSLMTLACVRLT